MPSWFKTHLPFVLPGYFLVLSIILASAGEVQRNKVIQYARGYTAHGVPDSAARLRFVDYAINAPAWAAAWESPNFISNFPSWGMMRTEAHWRYYIFLVLFWAFVGRLLEIQAGTPPLSQALSYSSTLIALFVGTYGIFVCDTAVSWDYWYEHWFTYSAFTWGFVCTSLSVILLLKSALKKQEWKSNHQYRGQGSSFLNRAFVALAVILAISSTFFAVRMTTAALVAENVGIDYARRVVLTWVEIVLLVLWSGIMTLSAWHRFAGGTYLDSHPDGAPRLGEH